jgi:hypothetical protein
MRASVTELNTFPPSYMFETAPSIVAYCTIYLAKIYSKILPITGWREIGLYEVGD